MALVGHYSAPAAPQQRRCESRSFFVNFRLLRPAGTLARTATPQGAAISMGDGWNDNCIQEEYGGG
jgi:hypothetical protein